MLETIEMSMRLVAQVESFENKESEEFLELCEHVKSKIGLDDIPPVQSRLHMAAVGIIYIYIVCFSVQNHAL